MYKILDFNHLLRELLLLQFKRIFWLILLRKGLWYELDIVIRVIFLFVFVWGGENVLESVFVCSFITTVFLNNLSTKSSTTIDAS